mgnify:CR=1 FL=1
MENKYVWGNEELNNQLTAIAYAKNENEMAKAIRECLKNIAIEWWKDLSEETKQAIRLVGFNHAVICSLMFFSPESVMCDYYPIRAALNDMVEAHAALITGEYAYGGVPIMPHDVNNRKYFWGTSENAIQATYYLNKCKKQLTEEVQNVARSFGIEDTKTIVEAAIERSSVVNNHRKNKAKYISELRKEYLHEIFMVLKNYDALKGE